jgi:Domain of unknown function (DUF4249)
MKNGLIYFVFLILADSCVERIDFESPDSDLQLVVDGMITDEPGPYTVKLSRTQQVYDLSDAKTVTAKAVTIFDDAGNSEVLTEIGPGEYQTSSTGIRGQIGRTYFVRIETFDGKVYESIPEKMTPAGAIENLYWEFEEFQPEDSPTQYRFNFFIDAIGNKTGDNLFRWKLNATYLVETNPELAGKPPPPDPPLPCDNEIPFGDPRSCSGYIFDDRGLVWLGLPCTCCTCWVSLPEPIPRISSDQVYTNGKLKRILVGAVPVDYWVFFDKVYIEVNQLSLTEKASNYWKTVEEQKEGASSLFQPAVGKAPSNIFLKNGNEEVQGYFFASAIVRKILPGKFLSSGDIPLGPGIIEKPCFLLKKESCLKEFRNSTNLRPLFWE